ncbi:MAG: hypothetical protein NDI77_16820 [Geobacteraceae bacterium]|nr:hypothetical protein [Geobacteraceae bacterium]
MSRELMKSIMVVTALTLALAGCLPHQQPGATAGGAMGGIAGAILDARNPWRGGIIGATLGAIAGATIADISLQGAREAAYAERPVEYFTEDRRVRYHAEPLGYDEERRCRRVRELTYVDGRLVSKKIVVICDRGRYDRPRYRYEPRYDRYELDEGY